MAEAATGRTARPSRIDLLLGALDEAFDTKAWHGTTLLGALRGVRVDQASWRPVGERHNIWELALHCAYWKYTVVRRLRGDKRGAFPRDGSNWFERPAPDASGEADWRADVALLRATHGDLRELVAGLDDNDLDRPAGRSQEHTVLSVVRGVALHDVHHGGQIQLIKRWYGVRD